MNSCNAHANPESDDLHPLAHHPVLQSNNYADKDLRRDAAQPLSLSPDSLVAYFSSSLSKFTVTLFKIASLDSRGVQKR